MKRILITAAVVAAAASFSAPSLADGVGISVRIGEPNYYGRLDIGGYPQPQLMFDQPMTIYQVPADRPPVYLRVPRNHVTDWKNHCGEYNSCDERVFFVDDNWYNREYIPRYRTQQR